MYDQIQLQIATWKKLLSCEKKRNCEPPISFFFLTNCRLSQTKFSMGYLFVQVETDNGWWIIWPINKPKIHNSQPSQPPTPKANCDLLGREALPHSNQFHVAIYARMDNPKQLTIWFSDATRRKAGLPCRGRRGRSRGGPSAPRPRGISRHRPPPPPPPPPRSPCPETAATASDDHNPRERERERETRDGGKGVLRRPTSLEAAAGSQPSLRSAAQSSAPSASAALRSSSDACGGGSGCPPPPPPHPRSSARSHATASARLRSAAAEDMASDGGRRGTRSNSWWWGVWPPRRRRRRGGEELRLSASASRGGGERAREKTWASGRAWWRLCFCFSIAGELVEIGGVWQD